MQSIEVKVIARASKCQIIPLDSQHFKVKLTRPALEGKANEQLRELLSAHFGVAKSKIRIVAGEKNTQKRIVVDD